MMQVILTQDVKKLGRQHEAVRVRPGYALNFLFPQGIAIPATPKRLEKAEKELAEILIQKEKIVEQAKEVKEALDGIGTLTIEGKTTDKDTLYGSVTEKDIIELIENAVNIRLEKKHVRMDGHIKKIGEHEVKIHISEGNESVIKVEVKASN